MHCNFMFMTLVSVTLAVALAGLANAQDNANAETGLRTARSDRVALRKRRFIGDLIDLGKFAFDTGCKLFHTAICDLGKKRKREAVYGKNEPAPNPAAVNEFKVLQSTPIDELVEKVKKQLREVAEKPGFKDLSPVDQEDTLLDAISADDQFMKDLVRESIDDSVVQLRKVTDDFVTYSHANLEGRKAMKKVFDAYENTYKTPKQKLDKVKQLQAEMPDDLRNSLKMTTDPEVLKEASFAFGDVPTFTGITKRVSVLPPKYLSIKGHEQCVDKFPTGSMYKVCLPAKKKYECAEDAWKALNALEGKDKLETCPSY
ncbi:hypothetical protein niasHS_015690 [Heterodera schachtii]|uniref:Uncharacterized protein n=1 Tax=Heterodera schachtii TaxID=97005 RepID=A0ABD2HUC9_HETSC